jgi:hypothetical protein
LVARALLFAARATIAHGRFLVLVGGFLFCHDYGFLVDAMQCACRK